VRVALLLLLFMAVFIGLGVRAFDLTILRHGQLQELAEQMHATTIKLTQPRGEIMDRNGEPLAVRITLNSVFAEPPRVENLPAAVEVLSQTLGLDRKTLAEKLTAKKHFVWIKRHISAGESAALEAVGLPKGVGRVEESGRQYPFGKLAAAVIGYADIDTRGLEGLELQYDKVLTGDAGQMIGLRDAKGKIFFPDGVQVEGFRPGGSLRLTLDDKIQWFAETALDHVVEQYHPQQGAWAIVMDVQTGEILALANRPVFDCGAPAQFPAENRRNRAITDMYEPGSTMKPITMASALEEGKIKLDDKIYCESGAFSYGGHIIHDTHGHGWLTPPQIIQVSSNIGASKIALRLGRENFHEWLERFGMGQPTGVDLPGEKGGLLRPYKDWWPITICTHAYGQGISVTSLQLLNAFCALGNGGRLMRPYLVAETLDPKGKALSRNQPHIERRVISEKVSQDIRAMMCLVTQPGGTATQAALPNFPVAGKTGTAYKVVVGKGIYSPTKRIGSFVGLVPGDNPRLGIIVVVDEPVGASFGGIVAAPAFKEIAERSLAYLGIYADPERFQLAQARRPDQRLVEETHEKAVGEIEQIAGEEITPNFIGLTMRRAMQLAQQKGVALSIVGSGVAIRQEPSAGKALPESKEITVQVMPQI